MRLYNSLTRQVEDFRPQSPYGATLYACGPTVYDTPHLGNARSAVVFDMLARVLRQQFTGSRYVRNYTDVDDKIIERASALNEPIGALTDRVIQDYRDVMDELGCERPQRAPRATKYIPDMIEMIQVLIKKGHAYEAQGHVLFSIASFPNHGALSRHEKSDLHDGARIAPANYKRAPADFVLWKPSEAQGVGWTSPWGYGRPGWHIECSAMIRSIFGKHTIDIHAGGADLRFPHHECEISQSECANDVPLARFWVHNGMVLVDGKKMAKSEGNFVTVRDLLEHGVTGGAIRLALLGTHYRSSLDWSFDLVTSAQRTLDQWFGILLPYRDALVRNGLESICESTLIEPLLDDLNTPKFIAGIHECLGKATGLNGFDYAFEAACVLENFGFFQDIFDPVEMTADEQNLFQERERARGANDYRTADGLRETLRATGIMIKDTKEGSLWWRQPSQAA